MEYDENLLDLISPDELPFDEEDIQGMKEEIGLECDPLDKGERMEEGKAQKNSERVPGSLTLYTHDIKDLDVYDAETEKRLAYELRAGREAMDALEKETEIESDRLEKLLADVEMGEKARDCLIESQVKSVFIFAKQMYDGRAPLEDMVQQGNLGLIRAVDLFDPDKGFRLSTFATKHIKYNIRHFLQKEQLGLIRVPQVLAEGKWKIDAYTSHHKLLNGGAAPSQEQIAKHTGLPTKTVKAIEALPNEFVSIQSGIFAGYTKKDEGKLTYEDTLQDEDVDLFMDTVNSFEQKKMRSDLKRSLHNLPIRDTVILALSFGTEDGIPRSLQDIGDELGGLTRQRVSAIQQKAMERIRSRDRVVYENYFEELI